MWQEQSDADEQTPEERREELLRHLFDDKDLRAYLGIDGPDEEGLFSLLQPERLTYQTDETKMVVKEFMERHGKKKKAVISSELREKLDALYKKIDSMPRRKKPCEGTNSGV